MTRRKFSTKQFDGFNGGMTVEVNIRPSDVVEDVSKSLPNGFKSTVRKSSVNEDKREIVCVAMCANEVDAHGDMFTTEAVEGASIEFLSMYNVTKELGLQHTGERPDVDLIGSWYTEKALEIDGLEVPECSWVVKMLINDDDVWDAIKKGDLTGVSIQGPVEGYQVQKEVSKSIDTTDDAASESSNVAKRIFTKAHPTNLDLVDAGANQKFLVWKAKKNMAKEENKDRETIEIVVKQKDEPQVSEAPEPTALVEVEASEPNDVVVETAKSQDGAMLEALLEIKKSIVDLGTRVVPPTSTTTTEVVESENDDAASEIAELKDTVSKALDKIKELESVRDAPAGLDDSVEVVVKKSTEGAFGGIFDGFFGD